MSELMIFVVPMSVEFAISESVEKLKGFFDKEQMVRQSMYSLFPLCLENQ